MRNLGILVYRSLIAPLGLLLSLTLGTLFVPKIRAGLRLRRQKREWPKFQKRPLWIHASSGEFEYAKPFIREVKNRHPEQPVVVTYFSPSYERAITQFPGVDFALPLPIDLPGPTRSFLQRLNPTAGFLARTDLWPELLNQGESLKIPLVLFSATKTKRPAFFPRLLNRWLYGYLDAIFCVSTADAEKIRELAPKTETTAIGDTRFDQVLQRLKNPKPLRENLRPPRAITIIAGSTWPEDERVLLDALAEDLRSEKIKLILAPHEPTPSHLNQLIHDFEKLNIHFDRYSQATEFKTPVLLVDQVGILAELYQWGSLALVGGSFRSSVHSVMEPLAAGCFTIVGPYHHNNREALDFQLVQVNGAVCVQVAQTSDELKTLIRSASKLWSPTTAIQIRGQIEQRCGASQRLADYFDSLRA